VSNLTIFLLSFYFICIILVLPLSKKLWCWVGIKINRGQGGYPKYDSSTMYAFATALILLLSILPIGFILHEFSIRS
jgi:ABC-type sulfate transport system permease component